MHRPFAVRIGLLLLVLAAALPVRAAGKGVAWETSRTFMHALLGGRSSLEPSVSVLALPEARQWLEREVPGKRPFVSFMLVGVDRQPGGFLGRVRLLRDDRHEAIYLDLDAAGRVTALQGLSDLIAASDSALRNAMAETKQGIAKRPVELASDQRFVALLDRHRAAAAHHVEVIERHIRTLRGE